ncbi:YSIRK-type signal peptide-containing protein [Staphylococcus haemolyticus]|uniref:YSIRK-type signal peptide-containing protein n=1 Tax=Staphylococcus haemolyticus TaxID=1283 RepID=UPI002108AEF7|nr:YSIRK-type signal peptide-containing protein [Staphylococcus haemolyticus]
MNQHNQLQKFSIRKYAIGTFSTLVATFVFLGVNNDAQASEHLNLTQQLTNNNQESTINESTNTSIQHLANNNTGQVQSNQVNNTNNKVKLIKQTNNDSSVSNHPQNIHIRKKSF